MASVSDEHGETPCWAATFSTRDRSRTTSRHRTEAPWSARDERWSSLQAPAAFAILRGRYAAGRVLFACAKSGAAQRFVSISKK